MAHRQSVAAANVRELSANAHPSSDDALVVTITKGELRELVQEAQLAALAAYEAGKQPAPDLVDGVEMSRRLTVSRTTLHRLRLAGMPAIALGDTFRYRVAAVLAWLEAREKP